MKFKTELPITFKTTFLVQLGFYFFLFLLSFVLFDSFETTKSLPLKGLLIVVIALFILSVTFIKYIRIEADGFFYKIGFFVPPEKIFWADIKKVEVRSVGIGERMIYFYSGTGAKIIAVGTSNFRPNEIKQFFDIVKEMAPSAELLNLD
jgi:hypothetical protein